jgi:hypothetical protein
MFGEPALVFLCPGCRPNEEREPGAPGRCSAKQLDPFDWGILQVVDFKPRLRSGFQGPAQRAWRKPTYARPAPNSATLGPNMDDPRCDSRGVGGGVRGGG